MISIGGGGEAPAVGAACRTSTRIAAGKVSGFEPPAEFVELVALVEPVAALSAVLNAQLDCQFAPS